MNIKTIQIAWYGSYSFNSKEKIFESNNYESKTAYANNKGLYQIYGHHPVYGSNSLLYIGKTDESIFSRISSHQDSWLFLIQGECKIYFGQILKTKDNVDSHENQIDDAERLLIDFYKPSYNAMLKSESKKITNRLIFNYGNYGKIERIIGTTYYETEAWSFEKLEDLFFRGQET